MNRSSKLVFVLIFMSVGASAAEWRAFNHPEGLFSFEAPEAVQVTRQTATRPDGIAVETALYAYRADRAGQTGCGIGLTEFGGGIALAEDTAQSTAAVFKAQLQTLKVQPEIDAEIAVDGRMGWRLEFKDLKGNGVALRLFVIENRLFQLTCTTSPAASPDDTAEVARVTSSLHFPSR
jgi:hypothetical protein